jgi:hypothetical protein
MGRAFIGAMRKNVCIGSSQQQKIIPENPCIGLTKFSVTNNKRGILKASGHLSDDIFKRYSSHTDENAVNEVGVVIEKTFEEIIPFKKAA